MDDYINFLTDMAVKTNGLDPMSRESLDKIRLTTQGSSGFNPASLQPAGPPSRQPYGPQSSDPLQQEWIIQTPMKAPDGTTYVQQDVQKSDGTKVTTGYVRPGPNGGTLKMSQGIDGQWRENEWHDKSFGQTVFGDKKLMAFLGIAGGVGGLAASGAFGATGGAGGAMLGGGTGATPGVVAGGTSGVAGLGGAGAGVTAGQIAGQVGVPEMGLIADPGTAAGAVAGGIPAGAVGAGSGALSAGAMQQLLSGQGGSEGFLNTIQQLIGNGQNGNLGGLANLIREGGSLALMREMYENSKDDAQEWRDFMKGTTPNLGFYEGKLKESYENPMSFLQGPQYQAAQSVVHNQLQHSDAAGGRLANDIGRQKLLQDHAMAGLDRYQTGLGRLVTDQQRTSSGQGSGALQNAQDSENQWMNNLMNWLQGQR